MSRRKKDPLGRQEEAPARAPEGAPPPARRLRSVHVEARSAAVESEFWPHATVAVAERSPGRNLGRTAVMKLVYLLQVIRGAPLGYDFRLYTSGPYDADVLDDLDHAWAVEAPTVKTVSFSSGYDFEIRPGSRPREE